jgi:hypothetical protein
MNIRFKVFASYNILQYPCDFIDVLIFVTVSKCRKNSQINEYSDTIFSVVRVGLANGRWRTTKTWHTLGKANKCVHVKSFVRRDFFPHSFHFHLMGVHDEERSREPGKSLVLSDSPPSPFRSQHFWVQFSSGINQCGDYMCLS